MSTDYQNLLKRFNLTRLDLPGTALDKFRERTKGLIEARWHRMRSPESMAQAIELYGFDCYMQGLMDAAQTCVMRPDLVADLRAMDREAAA